jgi:hypothetical protein
VVYAKRRKNACQSSGNVVAARGRLVETLSLPRTACRKRRREVREASVKAWAEPGKRELVRLIIGLVNQQ